jgi:hypothetical protein
MRPTARDIIVVVTVSFITNYLLKTGLQGSLNLFMAIRKL